ncbi:MAG: glutamyl-tRNA reductase [Acidobacteriaceae bacterium]
MDATLVIIGLDFHTSPVAVRERFWIPEDEQIDALHALSRSEGIEEAMILVTCGRTEFILWASDPTEGANSVLRFLTRKFDLKLSDWSNFYRLVDNTALLHLFRVTMGLSAMAPGDPDIATDVQKAWDTARRADTSGRFLDAIVQKALELSSRIAATQQLRSSGSVPYGCVQLSSEIFGSLNERSVLVLGAGKVAEMSAQYLRKAGIEKFTILGRGPKKAEQFAATLGGRAIAASQLRQELATADIVVAATSSPSYLVSASDVAPAMKNRKTLPLVFIDLAVPRNIDPDVREVTGTFLYDLDDLEQILQRNSTEQRAAVAELEKLLAGEVQGFCSRLLADQDMPTIVALRRRLEEICGQELRSLEDQFGPFTEDQQHALHSLASHITQRIAGGVARKLQESPEQAEQEQLTEAMQRLFHLQTPRRASLAQRN